MGKLSKDRRDIYYRKAKENGYRARSSYKLIQINDKFEIFKLFNPNKYNNSDISEIIKKYNDEYCYNIVDLCAAPGSWSQVLKNICLYNYYNMLYFINKNNNMNNELDHEEFIKNFSLYINFNDILEKKIDKFLKNNNYQIKEPKLVAVDLQEIGNMNYINIIQGDITKMSTINKILKCMNENEKDIEFSVNSPKHIYDEDSSIKYNKMKNNILNKEKENNKFVYAHAVVSDGAPDITGMNDIDEFIQSQLILSSLKVCCSVLKIGGNFISKIFRGEYTSLLIFHLNKFFEKIYVCKPQSSRNKSLESFLVCLNFHLPKSSITSLFRNTNEVCYNFQNDGELRNMHLESINGKDQEFQDLENNINDKTYFDDKLNSNLDTSDSEKENNLNINNNMKKKNLDIFNFYCSDSDEDIKYFNSDDEENFNNYISSNFSTNNKLFSFIATQNYYDSDKSYLLPQNYIRHEPQIMPLQPPYLLSLQNRRKENKKV
ncbi:ribosomal RNA methyltransferase, putative [Plasmodium berghei]|uniref:Putative tRNA (cytidine(32)/guanosine(34)-2'-O)-methyltransferase n=2 Tax=Plasmodium berghei TaxID=5821 RepID=A0A509AIF5_PLABA|nr:ribosomal RNA methyltransferase, putative [Plasmodium berghei ANKA]CXI30828.1 ribosomal RNA methyltransferase, putative [Plasmodium berghei]SCM20912.1 ribosomal RNA methyltransferase, putative [Plasmodium berghei]SCN24376.1 ribosomal RNA methyltransferase, putative [Plasmodium berghei]SCO59554.1 ribosomal RNA methyltransferase, putative [Plasmodium berghei]SCO60767.1 ribosomal RNA methyltransferase, putative [Plasmodium berghei]|eukprot:XP_034421069.1 ribosomal RNA methyltransferase, putative [Plasmodium berghei ANKA]